MTWFILSLTSVFALAAAELTQQHLLNTKNPFSPRSSAVLTLLCQSLLTIPFILLTPLRYQLFDIFLENTRYQTIIVTLIASVAMVFYLKSFQVKNISLSAIFVSSSVIVSTFLGVIFFKESTSYIKLLGIFLILAAIVSLNYKNSILEKNHFFGLLAGMLFGISYTLDKSIVSNINPIVYIFWAFFLVALFGFLLNPKEVILSVRGKTLSAFKAILFSGVGYFLYNLLTFNAYVLGGEVGRIDAINNTQIFLIILFEYLILKQKESLGRKLLTALIAFAGILLLGYL